VAAAAREDIHRPSVAAPLSRHQRGDDQGHEHREVDHQHHHDGRFEHLGEDVPARALQSCQEGLGPSPNQSGIELIQEFAGVRDGQVAAVAFQKCLEARLRLV